MKIAVCLKRVPDTTAKIVVGGHVANVPDLKKRIDADHVVRGEGVRWFRAFLGEDPERPYRHPVITSGIGTRNLGISLPEKPGDVAASVIVCLAILAAYLYFRG